MPSQSQYIAETPTGDLVPKSIVNFFERFYKISDSPDQHEEYAGCFTEDGVMVLASSRVEGRKGSFVSTSCQLPHQIFPFYNRICSIAKVLAPLFHSLVILLNFFPTPFHLSLHPSIQVYSPCAPKCGNSYRAAHIIHSKSSPSVESMRLEPKRRS